MTDQAPTIALWTSDWYGNLDYELFATEAEAAKAAVWVHWGDNDEPLGVQFADGRAIPTNKWPLFASTRAEMLREEAAKVAAQVEQPPEPTRTVRDPFSGSPVDVLVDAPSWLGAA